MTEWRVVWHESLSDERKGTVEQTTQWLGHRDYAEDIYDGLLEENDGEISKIRLEMRETVYADKNPR